MFHPTKTDGSSRSKFGARGERGEHGKDGKSGDVLWFSNLGVFRFSREAKNNFFLPDTLFTAFVAKNHISYMLGAHDPGSAQDVVVIYAALA